MLSVRVQLLYPMLETVLTDMKYNWAWSHDGESKN